MPTKVLQYLKQGLQTFFPSKKDAVEGQIQYHGFIHPTGCSVIMRISADEVTTDYADGDTDLALWNNRASLTYTSVNALA